MAAYWIDEIPGPPASSVFVCVRRSGGVGGGKEHDKEELHTPISIVSRRRTHRHFGLMERIVGMIIECLCLVIGGG